MINHSNENSLLDDANSPELDKRLLGLISEDFVKVADQLKEAAYQIRKRGFSDHPIFVATRTPCEIGALLFGAGELGTEWTYRASYLQEFVDRELIGEASVELFRENYRNPDEFCCIFAIHLNFAGFVFIPYPID